MDLWTQCTLCGMEVDWNSVYHLTSISIYLEFLDGILDSF